MDDLIPAAKMKDEVPDTTDQYWATQRHRGTGPVYTKVGPRKVYYRRSDVEKWLEDNRYTRPDRPVTNVDAGQDALCRD
jgi:hypothetical protein